MAKWNTSIELPADPVAPMEAATKQYVDNHAGSGDGSSGKTLKQQVFTTSGTWIHPNPGVPVTIAYLLQGGSGGGGSGAAAVFRAFNNSASCGGGLAGGVGALVVDEEVVTGDVTVIIGAGGVGGAPVAVSGTEKSVNGTDGTAGGRTTVGRSYAPSGDGGKGGTFRASSNTGLDYPPGAGQPSFGVASLLVLPSGAQKTMVSAGSGPYCYGGAGQSSGGSIDTVGIDASAGVATVTLATVTAEDGQDAVEAGAGTGGGGAFNGRTSSPGAATSGRGGDGEHGSAVLYWWE